LFRLHQTQDTKLWHLKVPVQLLILLVFSIPLELHLTTSELWFGQEQEGILP